ncbi:MAG TPA: polyprenyl diphosphate synthase, partial [Burkholderiales bacterium]|nr:polyprenyl diphosphate synthase [Burkholderiales bacterium]
FRVIGDRSGFGAQIVTAIDRAELLTRANTALTLTIAANYGGRWDIAQACRSIAHEVRAGSIDPGQIGPDLIEVYLATRDLPAPDLFIRTGGEQRISNFLLWPLAYTELYFTPVCWPDFDRDQLAAALAAYADRERRFGQTGEQVNAAGNA